MHGLDLRDGAWRQIRDGVRAGERRRLVMHAHCACERGQM